MGRLVAASNAVAGIAITISPALDPILLQFPQSDTSCSTMSCLAQYLQSSYDRTSYLGHVQMGLFSRFLPHVSMVGNSNGVLPVSHLL